MRHNINKIENGHKNVHENVKGGRLIADEARRAVTRRCIKGCDSLNDKKEHYNDINRKNAENGNHDDNNYNKIDSKSGNNNNNNNNNDNDNDKKNFAHNFITKSESAKIIFDAFGTAKTVKKYDSSKYGKNFTLLYRKYDTQNTKINTEIKDISWDDYFSSKNNIDFKNKKTTESQYEIVGGNYSTYLLQIGLLSDKNRGKNNQNFNVFYYLFSALTENVFEKSGEENQIVLFYHRLYFPV